MTVSIPNLASCPVMGAMTPILTVMAAAVVVAVVAAPPVVAVVAAPPVVAVVAGAVVVVVPQPTATAATTSTIANSVAKAILDLTICNSLQRHVFRTG